MAQFIVLDDGTTFGGLEGAKLIEVPEALMATVSSDELEALIVNEDPRIRVIRRFSERDQLFPKGRGV